MKLLACLAIALVACRYAAPAAADECCASCQCQATCCKVCRCVPTTKKVTKTVYHCECEDFCVPGPSTRCKVCDDCGKHHTVYTPNCAEVRTRKKLVKETKTEEVKTYKWVVESLCPNCAEKEKSVDPNAPPPPIEGEVQARHDARAASKLSIGHIEGGARRVNRRHARCTANASRRRAQNADRPRFETAFLRQLGELSFDAAPIRFRSGAPDSAGRAAANNWPPAAPAYIMRALSPVSAQLHP